MRRRFLSLAILLALTAPALADGWKKLDGEMAPALSAKEWLNADGSGPTIASLRGKVWLLEFFSTG
jgi:hypothetical protein